MGRNGLLGNGRKWECEKKTFPVISNMNQWFIITSSKFTDNGCRKSHILQQSLAFQLKAKAKNFGLKAKAKA